jgi:hypothetical protein
MQSPGASLRRGWLHKYVSHLVERKGLLFISWLLREEVPGIDMTEAN